MNKRFQVFMVILLALITLTCSLPISSLTGKDSEAVMAGEGEYPAAMAIVLDPDGNPVANAILGGKAIADSNGVASGKFQATATNWVAVDALGYASGYARSGGSIGETEIYETRLTSFSTLAALEPEESAVLTAGDAAMIETTIAGDDFASHPVVVGLAEIDPLDVGPLFEPLCTKENISLRLAFGLEAKDNQGVNVPLASGKELEIRILNEVELSDAPVIADFNPDESCWNVIPDGCKWSGEGNVLCTIPRLSPLFGLFESGEADYVLNKRRENDHVNKIAAAIMPPQQNDVEESTSVQPDTIDDLDEEYQAAYNRLKKKFQENEGNENWDPTTDPAIKDLMDDLARAARNHAINNRSESGKFHLLSAASQALLLGYGDLANALQSEATELANEIARDLLNKADCGRIREMLHAMEQVIMLAGDQSLVNKLEKKIEELYSSCDLWTGTVKISFSINPTAPVMDECILKSRGGNWKEDHEIKMATHAKTLVLKGEDHVKLNFPKVEYYDKSADCNWSVSFTGDPASNSPDLQFDGTYDGETFSLGELTPASYAKPTSVTLYFDFQEWDEEGENCVYCRTMPLTTSFPGYYSVLMHGLFDSPQITIQEMLDVGTKRTAGGEYEVIQGQMMIINPKIETGKYPFTQGTVIWHFIHVQKIIPLE